MGHTRITISQDEGNTPLLRPATQVGTLVRFSKPIPYAEAWTLQKQLQEEQIAERQGDVLLLLEHPPVYTLGRTTQPSHWDCGEEVLRQDRRQPAVCRSWRLDYLPWTRTGRGLSHTQAVTLLLRTETVCTES